MKSNLVKSGNPATAVALKGLLIFIIASGLSFCASGQSEESEAGGEETTESVNEREVLSGSGCVVGDCDAGDGTFIYENGDRYIGAFKNGEREGKGTFEYANGDRFIGEYLAGKRHGDGSYVFKNGDRYVGTFANGLRAGKGVYTFGNGGVFRGDFVEDGDKGEGTLVQGETPFDCDLRNKGLYCEENEQGKVIKEAVDDSNLDGGN